MDESFKDEIFCILEPKIIPSENLIVECSYKIGKYLFCEKFNFVDYEYKNQDIQYLLNSLAICAGTSYYKLFALKNIKIDFNISLEQSELLHKIYDEGLREFAFENNLEVPRKFIVEATVTKFDHPKIENSNIDIIPLGGGKDSAVTSTLLPDAHLFTINPSEPMFEVAKALGRPLHRVERMIDPQIIKMNEQGFYNGHIPVTAITSLVACIVGSLITDQKPNIILSNEYSASEATRKIVVGNEIVEINHQYSKSYDAEKHIRECVKDFVNYYSILRPLSELAIAKILSSEQFLITKILSCNNAFKIFKEKNQVWCGNCPKCFFTFLMLSVYNSPNTLEKIFGSNLLDNINNLDGFNELVDENIKPFECVGEINECKAAINYLANAKNWEEMVVVKEINKKVDCSKCNVQDFMSIQIPHFLDDQKINLLKSKLEDL